VPTAAAFRRKANVGHMSPRATGSAARIVCTDCIPSWKTAATEPVLPSTRAENKSNLSPPLSDQASCAITSWY
jgi:hypothetical protein